MSTETGDLKWCGYCGRDTDHDSWECVDADPCDEGCSDDCTADHRGEE